MHFTNEEWDAAMATDEFKAARAKGEAAYIKAGARFRKMAKALDDKETARVQKLQELEQERDRQYREKKKALYEQAREAGVEAQSKVAFDTICNIVRKMRMEAK